MAVRLTHLVRAHAPGWTEILFVSADFDGNPGKADEARARAASVGTALQVLGAWTRGDGTVAAPDDAEVEVLAVIGGNGLSLLGIAESASVSVSHHRIEAAADGTEWAACAVALGEAWAA